MISWTPEMKEIAKRDKKALVKIQVQLKHSTGGSFSMSGPLDSEQAMMLWLFSTLNDEEAQVVIERIAEVVAARKSED